MPTDPEVLVLDDTSSDDDFDFSQQSLQLSLRHNRPEKPSNSNSPKRARQSKKQCHESDLEARRRARIQRAFAEHQNGASSRRDHIRIVVSPELRDDAIGLDFLSSARMLFPKQLQVDDIGIPNLISWRRLANEGCTSPKDVMVSMLVFAAEDFVDKVDSGQLDNYVAFVKRKKQGHEIFFAICGMEKELRKRARIAVKDGSQGMLLSSQGIQDCYTYLYMEYGIRSRESATVGEVAQYVCDVTDAIANTPYHQNAEFMEATAKYSDSRRKLSHRTAVLSQSAAGSEAESEMGTSERHWIVRSEGAEDLGYMYLATLCKIPGISIHKARAIREKYPTLNSLFQAYKTCFTDKDRDGMLADIRFGPAKRRIGPASSKLVALVFTSMDSTITIQS